MAGLLVVTGVLGLTEMMLRRGVGSLDYLAGSAVSPLPDLRYAMSTPPSVFPRGRSGSSMTRSFKELSATFDDAALVERFHSGADPAGALEALFDRYGAVTYAFFCRGVGDPRIAEELNQDLYVEVIKSLSRFRGQSSLKTWLFRLAYNHLSNLRRRWRTHLDEQPVELPDHVWAGLMADGGPSAEARVDDEDARYRLRLCLIRLPEIERAVVLGMYYRGVTLQQLTEQLRLTNPSGARAFLVAAQRKLKKCMEQAARNHPARG
jgi:RNA polymerase sigma-70 factor (ECF subfamily)